MLWCIWKVYDFFMVYVLIGSGKIGLVVFIVVGLVSCGMCVLFVVLYMILINQIVQCFIEYGLLEDQISFIWCDYLNYDLNLLIQIVSVDMFIRCEFFKNIDLFIVDEVYLCKCCILKEIEWIIVEKKVKVIGLFGIFFVLFLGYYY